MGETTPSPAPPGRICHTEIVSKDVAASRTFFAQAFGWEFSQVDGPGGEPYLAWGVNGQTCGGITPPMEPEAPVGTLNYIAVEDVDQAVAAIQAAGGRVLQPRMDVGSFGRMAVFREPGGAVLAVWQDNGSGNS